MDHMTRVVDESRRPEASYGVRMAASIAWPAITLATAGFSSSHSRPIPGARALPVPPSASSVATRSRRNNFLGGDKNMN